MLQLKKFSGKPVVVLANYDKLVHKANHHELYQEASWMLVINDEGHMLRNTNTERSKTVFSLDRDMGLILTGVCLLSIWCNLQCGWCCNTGTPIQNYAKDAVSLATWLDNNQNKEVYRITPENSDVVNDEITNTHLLEQFVLRRRKADYLPDVIESMCIFFCVYCCCIWITKLMWCRKKIWGVY